MPAAPFLPFPGQEPGGRPALIAAPGCPAQVTGLIAEGPDLIDLGAAGAAEAAAFAAAYPGIAFCADWPGATVVRAPALAAATGAVLLCDGPDQAQASSLPPGRLLVPVRPAGVPAARRAGWLPLVDADLAAAALPDTAQGPAAALVVIAVCGWLGAAAVRASRVRQARRALDMAAAVAGWRPPARAVRGLA
jgi:dihydropteroate synthase